MSEHGGRQRPMETCGQRPDKSTPERERKLRELKASIKEGTYRPDIRDIANYLVRMMEPSL